MNEKFFDLKKEKQDRMINAGLQLFAVNGYRNTSTDEIVAAAQISKGLLFHYFASKTGYYSFLYDYITRYALLELNTRIRPGKHDFFELERAFLKAETALMEQYPSYLLFLDSVRLEGDKEALASLNKPEETVFSFYKEREAESDYSAYLRMDSRETFTSVLGYVKAGTMREVIRDKAQGASEYQRRMSAILDSFQRLAASL